jgi:flagellar protein FlaG
MVHCDLTGAIAARVIMAIPTQPSIQLTNASDYRESYANSVQVRVNVWDFFLVFGTLQQQDETRVEVRNFQGIYLSPQQAKALCTILQQNLVNYESTFGEIKLDPRLGPTGGPVH